MAGAGGWGERHARARSLTPPTPVASLTDARHLAQHSEALASVKVAATVPPLYSTFVSPVHAAGGDGAGGLGRGGEGGLGRGGDGRGDGGRGLGGWGGLGEGGGIGGLGGRGAGLGGVGLGGRGGLGGGIVKVIFWLERTLQPGGGGGEGGRTARWLARVAPLDPPPQTGRTAPVLVIAVGGHGDALKRRAHSALHACDQPLESGELGGGGASFAHPHAPSPLNSLLTGQEKVPTMDLTSWTAVSVMRFWSPASARGSRGGKSAGQHQPSLRPAMHSLSPYGCCTTAMM